MKGKCKSRPNRITLNEALYSCPNWEWQELVKLALVLGLKQAPKVQEFREQKGGRKDAKSSLPWHISPQCTGHSK